MMTSMNGTSPLRFAILIALALFLGTGCSVAPRGEPPSYGDWQPESAEPVDSVRFSNLIDWQALDRDWILLRFNGGRKVAVRPRDPCLADVREAGTLGLVSTMPNLLHRSDQLRLDGNLCLIEEIRSIPGADDSVRGAGPDSAGS